MSGSFGRYSGAGRVLEDPVVLEREEDLHAVLLPEVEAPLRIRIAGLGLVEPPLPGHHRVPLLEDARAGLLEELPRRVRVRGIVEPRAIAVALRQAAGVAEVGRGRRLPLVLDRLGGEVDEEGVAHVVPARGGVGGSGGRGQRGKQQKKGGPSHGGVGICGSGEAEGPNGRRFRIAGMASTGAKGLAWALDNPVYIRGAPGCQDRMRPQVQPPPYPFGGWRGPGALR